MRNFWRRNSEDIPESIRPRELIEMAEKLQWPRGRRRPTIDEIRLASVRLFDLYPTERNRKLMEFWNRPQEEQRCNPTQCPKCGGFL